MSAHVAHRATVGSTACALLVASFAIAAARVPPTRAYTFAYDGVLGTSLDLTFVAASAADASAAERTALAELGRVSGAINTYDAKSEISRLIGEGRIDNPSRDLVEVLRGYEAWNDRSGRAFTARAGELTEVWRSAQRTSRVPDDTTLARAVRGVASPAWRIDSSGRTIVALTSHPIDVNSLGKGYAIDRAMRAVQAAVPSLRGGMINIGGDIRVWGESPAGDGRHWKVGVVDPRAHADNALPLTRIAVRHGAVSSSGNYARGFDIAGRHYSHIIDPRTGIPADGIVGVTVIAHDNATANTLATTLSVLAPAEGLRLLRSVRDAEAIIITADGSVLRSPGFAALEAGAAATPAKSMAPAGVHAMLSADITPVEYNRHRPYVAVWVTDTSKALVRTLAQLGEKWKYIPELSQWYAVARSDQGRIDAVSRATRSVGQYTFEWDGRDEKGAAVPPGEYTFWLEAAYEHGSHSVKSVKLECRGPVVSAPIAAAAAFKGGKVECSVER